MLNCLIVDDEPLARQVLENYIALMPELALSGACANTFDAYRRMQAGPVELLFLDIKTPATSGIELIQSLKQPPEVIFTTAFAEFAAESYELNAVDYLPKPFSYERFCRAIEKFMKLNPEKREERVMDHLYIRCDNQIVRVEHADVLYIEARKDYMKFITRKGVYLTHLTMKALVGMLPTEEFLRVHRSYIVAKAAVTVAGKRLLRVGSVEVPVSENYQEALSLALAGTGRTAGGESNGVTGNEDRYV